MEGERKALKRRVGQGHIKLNCIERQRKNGKKRKKRKKRHTESKASYSSRDFPAFLIRRC
jgi:hypothetical protein